MSISSVSTSPTVQSTQPVQQARAARLDTDGDNEATESTQEKAREPAKSVNPNLGNNVDISV